MFACSREHQHIAVGVAASLRHAMPELVARFHDQSGDGVDVTYGASDALAAQARRGVGHDALVLAEAAALDELIATGTVVRDSRTVVATNSIVLVGPRSSRVTFRTLTALPAGARLAIGEPTAVPAGRYAQTYLQSLGAWAVLRPRLVFGGDVAGVLALAKQDGAYAVVYRTDANEIAPLVMLDEPLDAPIVHIVGGIVTKSRHTASARTFIEFLASADGQEILAHHGFAPPR